MSTAGAWADDQEPHDPAVSREQIDGLRALLGPAPRRVLELGCGAGRTLVPLATAGHEVIGMDRDPGSLVECRRRLDAAGAGARLVEADFERPWPTPKIAFDAVLCLGNTFMTIADMDRAVDVLRRAEETLAMGGMFVLDDCPGELWPELTGGNWTSGVSDAGDLQLVWHASDALFALRRGSDVDAGSEEPVPGEKLLRLWTDGALHLAARLAGLSVPIRVPGAHLLTLVRERPSGGDGGMPSLPQAAGGPGR